ncbi:MAG: AhpC/TSA family protein [Bacteroidales bacterium]|nr:AhpC/TSA family protein [Bacteroidales bacterium]
MQKTVLSLFIFILFVSCSSDFEGFKIKGKVNGGKGKTIFLSYSGQTDSVKINSDNEFEFNGTLSEPDFCNLYLDRTNPILLFIDSINNFTIEIKTDAENFAQNYSVSGSKTSQQIKELQSKLIQTFQNVKNLYNTMIANNNDTLHRDSIQSLYVKKSNEIVQQHRQYVFNFIKQNPSSFACLPAIYQAFDSRNPLFNYEWDAYYFNFIDSALNTSHPNSMHAKEFHAQVLQYKQQFANLQSTQLNTQIPTEAPDFLLNTSNGNTFRLSSLRGSFVLLDFWASWCSPCRYENPNLVNAYKKFAKKGLHIVQVSLDKDRNAWLQAIEKDNLSAWTHVSDLQYWNSPVAKLYNVQAIPANFLIDPNGKIIAQNLRGEQLFSTLEQIFSSVKKHKKKK